MKRLNKKISLITNLCLVSLFIVVFTVCFIPQPSKPIYGGKELSAIYNGNRQNKKVSLMFNVYENTPVVNGILDLLKQKGVKATFFVGGCWADDNGETLLRIVNEEHELANHGYFHKDHKKLGERENEEEIKLTGAIVKALSGVQTNLFAPPSGSFSVTTLEVASRLGYKVIMWSKDTIDWRDSNQDLLFNRATKNPENGDFILMHPKQHTLEVLPRIIDYYKLMGFNIVTVSNSLAE